MKKYIILLVIAIGFTGCAGLDKKSDVFDYRIAQEKNLASAKRFLEKNKVAAATDVLTNICSAKGVNGVTDEALFRLALLYLDRSQGRNDTSMAQQTLDRLLKEYPTSSWRVHATSLNELIATLNRRIRSLKGENISLSRENRELHLNIEKLKILDIEQEQKHKH